MTEPSKTQQPTGSASDRVAWATLVLDFLAKAFYPAILVMVLLMLRPNLAEIDLPGLINRLQSASVAGAELTFTQAEDVADSIAPLNWRIAEFELTIDQLREQIDQLQTDDGQALAAEPSAETRTRIDRFERHADYTVLVFNAPNEAARERSASITQRLLKWGYPASSTETDFNELSNKRPPGTVLVTYTRKGEEVLDTVEELLEELDTGAQLVFNQDPVSLRRGELQVMVF